MALKCDECLLRLFGWVLNFHFESLPLPLFLCEFSFRQCEQITYKYDASTFVDV